MCNLRSSFLLLVTLILVCVLLGCGREPDTSDSDNSNVDQTDRLSDFTNSISSSESTITPEDNPSHLPPKEYHFIAGASVPEGMSMGDLLRVPELPELTYHLARKPLKGEFKVSNTGEAQYSLMFDLPPAIAGYTPEIGITYNGSNSLGDLRNGWSIIGVSEISKCSATKVNDGYIGSVTGEASPSQRFCLDGMPLILISGGEYGDSGTEYVTQRKASIRIKAFGSLGGGPEYFELKEGSGVTKVFGRDETSRTPMILPQEIYQWKQDRVIDPSGNEVVYEYSSTHYGKIQQIFYQGKTENVERSVRLFFRWENILEQTIQSHREDSDSVWGVAMAEKKGVVSVDSSIGGYLISNSHRLSGFHVSVNSNDTHGYHFKYDEKDSGVGSPPKSFLREIRRCGGGVGITSTEISTRCSPPISFEWNYEYKNQDERHNCSFPDENDMPGGPPMYSHQYKYSKPYNKDFGWGGGNYYSQVLGDFNNDESMDIAVVHTYKDGNDSRLNAWIAYANGDGTFSGSDYQFSEIIGKAGIINHRLSGDFNNDGYADLLATNSSAEGWNSYIALNRTDGTFESPKHQKISSINFIDDSSYKKITGDFNGDGNLDLMVFNIGNGAGPNDSLFNQVSGLVAYVATGNGDGTFNEAVGRRLAPPVSMAKFLVRDRGIVTADFNNDGITDIGSLYHQDRENAAFDPYVGIDTVVAFGTETGEFLDPIVEKTGFPGPTLGHSIDLPFFDVTDINADGYMDMVYFSVTGRHAHVISFIGLGDGTFKQVNYWDRSKDFPDIPFENCDNSFSHHTIFFDFNRDGFADFSRGGNTFYIGRGDGTFLKQGGMTVSGDTIKPTGGGSNTDSFAFEDTTYGVYALDVDKDDIPDVMEVLVDYNGLAVGSVRNIIKVGQNKIRQINEGGGRTIDLNYESIKDSNVYSFDPNAEFPFKSLRSGKTVVSRVTMNNPLGGEHYYDYHYYDLLVDVEKKVSLGFSKIQVTDSREGMKTVLYFDRRLPLIGLQIKKEVFSKDGILLSDENIDLEYEERDYVSDSYTHTHYIVKELFKNNSRFNTDGDLISRTGVANSDFDDYGNPRWIQIVRSDGYSTIIERDYYSNDNWSSFINSQLLFEVETRSGPDLNDSVTRETLFKYFENGLLKEKVIEPSKPNIYLSTSFEYYIDGQLKKKTLSGSDDAEYPIESQVESYKYDLYSSGSNKVYTTDITNAEGHTRQLAKGVDYNQDVQKRDVNGLLTKYKYDSYGDLYLEQRPDETTTAYTQVPCDISCPKGALYRSFVVEEGNPIKVFYFNMEGEVIRSIASGFDGTPLFQDTYYDAFSRKEAVSETYYAGQSKVRAEKYTYDILNRIKSTLTPKEGRTDFRYKAREGKGISVTKLQHRYDSNGLTILETVQKQSVSDKVVEIVDASNNSTYYEYDAFENLSLIVDPSSNKLNLSYDDRGRKTSVEDLDSGLIVFGIDALGLIRRQKDSKEQEISWYYDRLNRKIEKNSYEGASYWVFDTSFNGIGKIAQEVSNSGFKKTYVYDQYSRLELLNHAWNDYENDQILTYDVSGRLFSVSHSADLSVFYHYNEFGYLKSVANHDGEALGAENSMIYWSAEEMFPNGEVRSEGYNNSKFHQIYRQNMYTGRLQEINSESVLVPSQRVNMGFAFDSLGNLEWRGDYYNSISESFVYDALNRLKDVYVNGHLEDSYDYDAIGNITFKSDFASTYEYGQDSGSPRAVSSVIKKDGSVLKYNYDKNGNMMNGGGRAIEYTSDNRPIKVTQGATSIVFEYDANGRRVLRKENGAVTYYIKPAWDRGVSFEFHQKATESKAKLYVNALGAPVAVAEKFSGTNLINYFFFHKDHLGSVVAISNERGLIEESTSYKAFGGKRAINRIVSVDSPLVSERTTRGFTGHEHLDRVGLIHMNARLYDPNLGRFLSPDSIIPSLQNPQSINRYSYVYNNPLSLVDPTGHAPSGNGLFAFVDRFLARVKGGNSGATDGMGKEKYDSVNHNSSAINGVHQTVSVPSAGLGLGSAPRLVENKTFIAGAKSFFDDLDRVEQHYNAMNGALGDKAKHDAVAADLVLTSAVAGYYFNAKIEMNGKVYHIRQETHRTLSNSFSENPEYFAGRSFAQGGVGMAASTVMKRAFGLKLLSTRTGALTAGVMLGNAGSLLSISSYGRGLNLYDQGVRNPIDLLAGSVIGTN